MLMVQVYALTISIIIHIQHYVQTIWLISEFIYNTLYNVFHH